MAVKKRGREDLTWADAVRAVTRTDVSMDTLGLTIDLNGPAGCESPPWDEHTIYQVAREGSKLQMQRRIGGKWEEAPLDPPETPAKSEHQPAPGGYVSSIKIFISHSSDDKAIVAALIAYLEASLNLPDDVIRCTSVHGYKLEGGDETADVLRADLESSKVVIGVFTAASTESAYVLMELGGGWALKKRRIPLIGPGADFEDLKGPYHELHGIKLADRDDMATVPGTITKATGFPRRTNEGKASAALSRLIDAVNAAVEASKDRKKPTTKDKERSAVPAMDDGDIVIKLKSWLGRKLQVSGMDYSEIEDDAGVPRGTARRLLPQWVTEPWRVEEQGSTVVTLARGPERIREVERGRFKNF